MDIYLNTGNSPECPLDLGQVIEQIQSGQVELDSTFAWVDGMGED
ncbi:MAG: hypothetical protein AAF571_07580 [Verrucomicrobiota bacterium]